MTPPENIPLPSTLPRRPRANRVMAGILITLFLLLDYWLLARSCSYQHQALARYALYVFFYVWLPGHALLVWSTGERITLTRSLALGLPLGFVIEIGQYLALSALGLRSHFQWLPLAASLALVIFLLRSRPATTLLPDLRGLCLWPVCALAGASSLIMMTAAARMYAPAPLWNGLLLQQTHHDWVYLISLAGEIKNRWPLEDPSLAGTPLRYHYFWLVHVAAASRVTGLELPLVLLRLAILPLAAALLMQTFWLGRLAGRSIWAGVGAVFLLLATGEVSWQESTTGGLFQSLFIQWLYVSPTFFFGMIFMGALLIAGHRILCAATADWRAYLVLFLLAFTATGAKGTTLGPLVLGTGLWILWHIAQTFRWPPRMLLVVALLLAGFALAFTLVLRQWSGAGAKIHPLAPTKEAAFWLAYADPWQAKLEAIGLAPEPSADLAQAACAVIIFAGFNGVLLLGLFAAFTSDRQEDHGFRLWLGCVSVACIALGQLLYLDSHGELYLYLPIRLPLAVLTAAVVVDFARRMVTRYEYQPARLAQHLRSLGLLLTGLLVIVLIWEEVLSFWLGVGLFASLGFLLAPAKGKSPPLLPAAGDISFARFLVRKWMLLIFVGVLTVQFSYFLHGNRSGFKLWRLTAATAKDDDLAALYEGLNWLRQHTPEDALIIANLFTPDTVGPERPLVVDRTTADKYYYYSALARRRLFIGGPAYLSDPKLAAERLRQVAAINRGEDIAAMGIMRHAHLYLLIDARLASAHPSAATPVFQNQRISLYRLQ
jgi:hypothetical protein